MADETVAPPLLDAAPPPATPSPAPLLRPRREAFEHGLLPIPKLIFPEGTLACTLGQLKEKLAAVAIDWRVDAAALAEALQIPQEQAALALCTLAGVLPSEDAALGDGGGVGAAADIRDVLLFLYIQPYKRLVPLPQGRGTSTSASDGYRPALSPANQLVCSNRHCFMPSQADEEIHQLSYLQRNMENIITLLADSVEGDGNDSLVLTMDTFEHLGFLVQFSEGTSLSQAANFFANSQDMPAAPVAAAQVFDWMSQNITSSLESNHQTVSDLDVTMTEANTSHPWNSTPSANPAYYRNITFVEGFSKTSIVKHASDVKGNSIKVLNCRNSVIYILAPLKYATVYGCSNARVVLGAVGKVVKVENCERVHITATAKSIRIANCRECIFYLGVNHQPIVSGNNHNLRVAPFNTCYPQLRDHMKQVGIDPSVNKWDQPFVLAAVDPRDSLSYPAGVSDVINAESTTCLEPDLFTNISIPSCFRNEMQEHTNYNPFPLPEIYGSVLDKKGKKRPALEDIQKTILTERKERPYAECKLLGGSGPGESNESLIDRHQSLVVYLESAKNVHIDPDSGLPKDQLVQQFYMPWNGKKKVKYTQEGYSIIGGLISHVTNTHLNNKSWDGNITTEMFFVCQGQIHISQLAVAKKVVGSADARWNDLYALIKLIQNASVLKLPPPNKTDEVYPLHLLNLCNNVEKISHKGYSVEKRRVLAMSSNFATYIRCNPAFLSHSQKSCIWWHLRRFELSRSKAHQKTFRDIIIEKTKSYGRWTSEIIDENHRMFYDTFQKAIKNGARYGNDNYDLYRFVRDWHTHCLEPTKDADPAVKKKDAAVKSNYGFEVLETIAENHFGSYLSDILFNLLCDDREVNAGSNNLIRDEHIHIEAWLSNLKPALPPIQSHPNRGG